LDEVNDKVNFFNKTKTKYIIIDRDALAQKYPEYKDIIKSEENVASTNSNALYFIAGGIAGAFVGFLGLAACIIGGITGGLTGGLLAGFFKTDRIEISEKSNTDEYRDRDKNNKNRRG
jgi:hypothetical protein